MKITVFGATGDTGKLIVELALQAGYEVVAYARNPSKLNIINEHLTVISGDLSDETLIETAVKGSDAVLSALGPRGGSKDKPLTQGITNIIGAMKKPGRAQTNNHIDTQRKRLKGQARFKNQSDGELRQNHHAFSLRGHS